MQKLIILTVLGLLLAGCSWLPDVYTVPRFQGNVVEQKMIDQLKPGMTRDQVTYIMGTPLVADPYYPERWDYVYTTQTVNDDRTQEHMTLLFQGDSLASLRGDFKPDPQPEGVTLDGLESSDSEEQPVKETRAPQPAGEDTTLYTGGAINPAPQEGTVTEETHSTTEKPASEDPYAGLTPDGKLKATPSPTPAP